MMPEQRMGDETAAARPGFARRNALVLVVAVILATVVAVTVLTWGSQQGALGSQGQRIGELEGQLRTAELAKSEQVAQNVLESLGVSQGRIDKDAPNIDRLVRTAFTWDSGQSYETARATLKERHNLSEDQPFLQQSMPPSRFNEDDSGRRYYYIDTQGMNSSVAVDPDIEVVKVNADQYTYAVLVEVSITSDAVTRNNANPGSVSTQRTMLLFLTVDAEGGVSNLSGVPASGSTRHSG
jgi:hypothetical protein